MKLLCDTLDVHLKSAPPHLQTEEEDLWAIEEVLTRPAPKLNTWRHKFIMLQEITDRSRPAGGARDARIPAAKGRSVAETSV